MSKTNVSISEIHLQIKFLLSIFETLRRLPFASRRDNWSIFLQIDIAIGLQRYRDSEWLLKRVRVASSNKEREREKKKKGENTDCESDARDWPAHAIPRLG